MWRNVQFNVQSIVALNEAELFAEIARKINFLICTETSFWLAALVQLYLLLLFCENRMECLVVHCWLGWHTFEKSEWDTLDKSVWDTSDRQPLGTKCVLRPTKAGRGRDGEKPLCDESGGISPQDSDSKQQLQIISRERNSERKDSKEFSAKEVLKRGKNLLKIDYSCKHGSKVGLVLVKE